MDHLVVKINLVTWSARKQNHFPSAITDLDVAVQLVWKGLFLHIFLFAGRCINGHIRGEVICILL